MSVSLLVSRAAAWPGRTALAEPAGTATYERLLETSALAASALLVGGSDLVEARVVFLLPPGIRYVETQWAIWRAGGVAVPLSASQVPADWDYVISDTRAAVVVGDDPAGDLASIAAAHGARYVEAQALVEPTDNPRALPDVGGDRRAMILYTSGTTSRPKGVVTTHRNLEAQMTALTNA
jgi:malonyl-CoA/methylmalonyl-CoA synthetase